MHQIFQRLDSGIITVADVPVPMVSGPQLVVESRASVVSAGTERMLLEFGRANLVEKAKSQPDKVRQVVDKIRTSGLADTVAAVRAKLDSPIPLGYCQAGVVIEAGPDVTGFAVGDRVVTNGPHAEYVRVTHTLAARIPDEVTFEAAAFTPLAAIGLEGIRLASPSLGETFVVFGLGLIGLLTVQLLRANGCAVIGIDRDVTRVRLAEEFGARGIVSGETEISNDVIALTHGVGADGVLLTLSSDSNEPIRQAAKACRKRGRIVLVGVTGLSLSRDEFFAKELSFSVSGSYGPGRYDPSYENQGHDYPVGYVRWTLQRNFVAVLQLMASGAVNPERLVSHRIAIKDAPKAYDILLAGEPSLGLVLQYPGGNGRQVAQADRVVSRHEPVMRSSSGPRVAVIGAGNYAARTLLPVLKASGASLGTIVATGGATASLAAVKFGFEKVASDAEVVFADPAIDTVFIATRHDSHAALVLRALAAHKSVFVEKPLALTESELDAVESASRGNNAILTVGFNRRYAPLARRVQREVATRSGPLVLVVTVNAGAIPKEHWTQDPKAGGGRIVGEACHWLDLARAIVGASIREAKATTAHNRDGTRVEDIAHISVSFADGSTAAIHYLANGASDFPKERIECFFDGKTLTIDNWRRLLRFGGKGAWFVPRHRIDKGHTEEIRAWLDAVSANSGPPIPLDELFEVSRWAIRIAELVRAG
ncbi:MAG TPA: bi-domain-containing oxidoreductase [Gemmatimonadaceae bacterium]|nr:bi-domain-containing oxidoreductase [Gemmatimonadaceae bacterium]